MQSSLTETLQTLISDVNTSVKNAQDSVLALQDECQTATEKANAIQPHIDEKLSQVSVKLKDFQQETETKLGNLNKLITDSLKRSVADSEAKHLSLLEGIEDRLDTYKKDIEYKLSQIQNFSEHEAAELQSAGISCFRLL